MKILLIHPANPENAGRDLYSGEIATSFVRWNPFQRTQFELPLALPTLAGLTPKQHEVRIIDEAVEPIDFDEACDLVGLTAMTFKAKRAYAIAREFRARGRTVVMGGIHATMCPEEASEHVDCIVSGEADEIWPCILEDYEHGALQRFYRAQRLPDISQLPPPDHSKHKFRRYTSVCLQTSRGCPHDCSFCTVTQMNGRTMRYKSPEQVVREVDAAVRLNPNLPLPLVDQRTGQSRKFVAHIFFVDDNFAVNRKLALAICRALTEYQRERRIYIEWLTQVNVRVGLDDELLSALRDAGCRQLFMGFETLDPSGLQQLNKGFNRPADYARAIKNVRRFGLEVVFSTILGTDCDTPKSFDYLAKFVEDNDLTLVLPNILTPYPGTRLFRELQQSNRITEHDWDRYNVRNVVFAPRRMTQGELQLGYGQLCARIFDFHKLVERGKRAYAAPPEIPRMTYAARLIIICRFCVCVWIMGISRRLEWSVVKRLWRELPPFLWKTGTMQAAWSCFAITADYDDFGRQELARCQALAAGQRFNSSAASPTVLACSSSAAGERRAITSAEV